MTDGLTTDRDLDGRATLVTGASRGAGAAIARAFAERGAKVGLLSRSGDDLGLGDSGLGVQCDVASREQVQVHISFPHQRDWLDLSMGWWEYAIRSWRRRAPPDATFTFLCELGPREYAMTGPDGYELSDRWEEALMLKGMIRALWDRIEAAP